MTKDANGNEISLASDYAGNPVIRALIQLIPNGLGSAFDVIIMDRADRIKKQRVRTFFDELETGAVVLTKDLINDNEFLHSLNATMIAAFRSRREQKIRMFARLLQNGAVEGKAKSPDDYEELLNLLDDLSYREWEALILFKKHLDTTPPDENPLKRVNPIWEVFVADLESILNVEKEEASSFMTRISRTGLYNEITGTYWDYSGGMGITTPKFERFRRLVEQAV
ncbi:hypothetical protein KFK14_00130 [Sphingobium phenoxybenzoativorans]|uniref:Uncharacterized protein n=1 Tax=Sphingobium phenoxybenzoativorans TaxID=1592790 RepID=A0A975K710_9SPHN|nr:hypothetical protein [Sphingobium phenoxybenzoativorans]QUT05961.1 hypothetical protein KFK14_00130 [Sphingobium phenoxybenzoativorans]